MARIKYYYDTETCKYERIKVGTWDIILNLLGFLSVAFLLSIVIVFVYGQYFESPKEALLAKENKELKFHYDLVQSNLVKMDKMLASLQDRDDNTYRVIFEADPIPSTVRTAGTGGINRYEDLLSSGLEQEDLILSTYQSIDQLKKRMLIQTLSYDEIEKMAENKSKLLAAIPAIQPVDNKELKRLSSSYGVRMHPILKVRKFHAGIDFSAPRGTPIYATGDGVIKKTKTSYGGLGKHIVIDHGFGYVTKYGHMSGFAVKKGQKIKRGELIGYVGNSGRSTAPHLHYEVHKDNKTVNPIHYFYRDLNEEQYAKLLDLASKENQSLD